MDSTKVAGKKKTVRDGASVLWYLSFSPAWSLTPVGAGTQCFGDLRGKIYDLFSDSREDIHLKSAGGGEATL